MTRVWLDDERPAPEGWVHVTTASAAIELLAAGGVTEMSFDHDLGPPEAGTGCDVACVVEERAADGSLAKFKWRLHSANVVGRVKMRVALRRANRHWEAHDDAYWAEATPGERVLAAMQMTADFLAKNPGHPGLRDGKIVRRSRATAPVEPPSSEQTGVSVRSPTYYLVIDLEATCDEGARIPRSQSEIIEIGAVLVAADTLLVVEEFQTFVKPGRHSTLTPFCSALTSITQADVDGAPEFPRANRQLGKFVAGRDALFSSWGEYDKNQYARDAHRHDVRGLGEHWNLKEAFRAKSGDSKKLGVGEALARVGLVFQGTAHRGIDDARNIARLLPYALGRVPIPPAPEAPGTRKRKRGR